MPGHDESNTLVPILTPQQQIHIGHQFSRGNQRRGRGPAPRNRGDNRPNNTFGQTRQFGINAGHQTRVTRPPQARSTPAPKKNDTTKTIQELEEWYDDGQKRGWDTPSGHEMIKLKPHRPEHDILCFRERRWRIRMVVVG